MKNKWYVEGTWSGYTGSQSKVCHRDYVSNPEEIKIINSIRFTDGTRLDLEVKERKPREKIEIIKGYNDLIDECINWHVRSVDDLMARKKNMRMF